MLSAHGKTRVGLLPCGVYVGGQGRKVTRLGYVGGEVGTSYLAELRK